MKKVFYILIFVRIVFSQPNLDSLRISIQELDEIVQIRTLGDLCWKYRSSVPDSSIRYGMAALDIINRTSETSYKAQTLNYLGVIYGNLGNLDSAYYYYQKAMMVAVETEDSIQIAYSFNNLGDYYYKKAIYSIALEKIFEAYNIFEKLQDKKGIAYCRNDIGEIYLIQENYPKALEFFNQSGEIRIQENDERGYAKSLLNMANVYAALNRNDEALDYYDRAMYYSNSSDYIKGKSWILSGIADIYHKQKNYHIALQKRNEALSIDIKISNKLGEIINYNRIGLIHIALNNRKKAEKYFERSRKESENTGHFDQLMIAYRNLTELALSDKNYKLAFELNKKYEIIQDSIFNRETLNKISELQSAFVIERKDRENEMLKKSIEHEKTTVNFFILVSLLIFTGIVLVILRYKSAREANLLLSELNASKDKFFSIIAHDLKNPFGAVSNIAALLKEEYDEIDDEGRKVLIESIASAAGDVQNLLMDLLTWARSQRGEFSIHKENVNVRDILNSIRRTYELLAKNKNISIFIESDDNLEINVDKFILETVIGNFLNNAIKFSENKSKIILSGKQNGNGITFSVQDFGKGIEKNLSNKLFNMKGYSTPGTKNEKGTGLGLTICKEFTELHGGTIHVESTPGKGSTFSVKIPY